MRSPFFELLRCLQINTDKGASFCFLGTKQRESPQHQDEKSTNSKESTPCANIVYLYEPLSTRRHSKVRKYFADGGKDRLFTVICKILRPPEKEQNGDMSRYTTVFTTPNLQVRCVQGKKSPFTSHLRENSKRCNTR